MSSSMLTCRNTLCPSRVITILYICHTVAQAFFEGAMRSAQFWVSQFSLMNNAGQAPCIFVSHYIILVYWTKNNSVLTNYAKFTRTENISEYKSSQKLLPVDFNHTTVHQLVKCKLNTTLSSNNSGQNTGETSSQ